jgi:hypothetical protein
MQIRQDDKLTRSMDYSRPQYGGDQYRTENTSSGYDNDVHDSRERPMENPDQWTGNDGDFFLDDYRLHHGLPVDPSNHWYEHEKFYYRYNNDFGETYISAEDLGFFQSLKESFRNFLKQHTYH